MKRWTARFGFVVICLCACLCIATAIACFVTGRYWLCAFNVFFALLNGLNAQAWWKEMR